MSELTEQQNHLACLIANADFDFSEGRISQSKRDKIIVKAITEYDKGKDAEVCEYNKESFR